MWGETSDSTLAELIACGVFPGPPLSGNAWVDVAASSHVRENVLAGVWQTLGWSAFPSTFLRTWLLGFDASRGWRHGSNGQKLFWKCYGTALFITLYCVKNRTLKKRSVPAASGKVYSKVSTPLAIDRAEGRAVTEPHDCRVPDDSIE
jgi:hypothetical protein